MFYSNAAHTFAVPQPIVIRNPFPPPRPPDDDPEFKHAFACQSNYRRASSWVVGANRSVTHNPGALRRPGSGKKKLCNFSRL